MKSNEMIKLAALEAATRTMGLNDPGQVREAARLYERFLTGDREEAEPQNDEEKCQFVDRFCFSTALAHIKCGYMVARSGWNGKGMHIELQVPDENSKMSRPYIFMFTADKQRVPWVASQTDLLAEDWSFVAS